MARFGRMPSCRLGPGPTYAGWSMTAHILPISILHLLFDREILENLFAPAANAENAKRDSGANGPGWAEISWIGHRDIH